MDRLPVFELVIDPSQSSDIEVSYVALVDKPAIERNFLAFNSVKLDFVVNQDQQIISGPAMVADSLIYRRDDTGEYNVFFSKDTIKDIAIKFFQKDYQRNINLFHDRNLSTDDVTIFESFVSDKERGIPPMKGFEDLPDGTWFISAKVSSPEIWADVKSGKVRGFSVEGMFNYIKKPQSMQQEAMAAAEEFVKTTISESVHLKVEKQTLMSNLKQFFESARKAILGEVVTPAAAPAATPATPAVAFTDYQTKDGKTVKCESLTPGSVLMLGDVAAPAGEYELTDGTKVVVGDGGLISSVEPGAMAPADMTEDKVSAMIQAAISNLQQASAQVMQAADAKVAGLEADLQATKQSLSKQQAINKQLFELIEKVADLPAGEEPGSTASLQSFHRAKAEGREGKIREIAEILHNRKKAQ